MLAGDQLLINRHYPITIVRLSKDQADVILRLQMLPARYICIPFDRRKTMYR